MRFGTPLKVFDAVEVAWHLLGFYGLCEPDDDAIERLEADTSRRLPESTVDPIAWIVAAIQACSKYMSSEGRGSPKETFFVHSTKDNSTNTLCRFRCDADGDNGARTNCTVADLIAVLPSAPPARCMRNMLWVQQTDDPSSVDLACYREVS